VYPDIGFSRLIRAEFTIDVGDRPCVDAEYPIKAHQIPLRSKSSPSENGSVFPCHRIALLGPNVRFTSRVRQKIGLHFRRRERPQHQPFADERAIHAMHRRGVIGRVRDGRRSSQEESQRRQRTELRRQSLWELVDGGTRPNTKVPRNGLADSASGAWWRAVLDTVQERLRFKQDHSENAIASPSHGQAAIILGG